LGKKHLPLWACSSCDFDANWADKPSCKLCARPKPASAPSPFTGKTGEKPGVGKAAGKLASGGKGGKGGHAKAAGGQPPPVKPPTELEMARSMLAQGAVLFKSADAIELTHLRERILQLESQQAASLPAFKRLGEAQKKVDDLHEKVVQIDQTLERLAKRKQEVDASRANLISQRDEAVRGLEVVRSQYLKEQGEAISMASGANPLVAGSSAAGRASGILKKVQASIVKAEPFDAIAVTEALINEVNVMGDALKQALALQGTSSGSGGASPAAPLVPLPITNAVVAGAVGFAAPSSPERLGTHARSDDDGMGGGAADGVVAEAEL